MGRWCGLRGVGPGMVMDAGRQHPSRTQKDAKHTPARMVAYPYLLGPSASLGTTAVMRLACFAQGFGMSW